MRLYKLLTRTGGFKARLWPWFAPPPAEFPVRYFGWRWDPAISEWVRFEEQNIKVEIPVWRFPKPKYIPRPYQELLPVGWHWNEETAEWEEIPLTPIEIDLDLERGPRPEWPPGPELPDSVEGWAWDYDEKVWRQTIISGRSIFYNAPPPMPPDLTEQQIIEAGVYNVDIQQILKELQADMAPVAIRFRNHINNLMLMLERSGKSPTEARRLMTEYVKITAGMGAAEKKEVWLRATQSIYHTWRNTHLVSPTRAQMAWAEYVKNGVRLQKAPVSPDIALVAIYLAAALFGALLGWLLDELLGGDVDTYNLHDDQGTYLLGPENWAYAKHIGTSIKGSLFYSSCEGIGTEYVRHKRQRGKIGIDVIDFPGGFVETGYQIPYWVKYNWSFWAIEYIGMLESRGSRFYQLKKSDHDRFAIARPRRMLPPSRWCANFHYYL